MADLDFRVHGPRLVLGRIDQIQRDSVVRSLVDLVFCSFSHHRGRVSLASAAGSDICPSLKLTRLAPSITCDPGRWPAAVMSNRTLIYENGRSFIYSDRRGNLQRMETAATDITIPPSEAHALKRGIGSRQ